MAMCCGGCGGSGKRTFHPYADPARSHIAVEKLCPECLGKGLPSYDDDQRTWGLGKYAGMSFEERCRAIGHTPSDFVPW